jgi:hypothetical protein
MKLHTSCDTLLLSDFITCQCDKVLDSLVIEGTPTEEEKQAAWELITQEYYSQSNQKTNSMQIELCADIDKIKYKLIVIQECIDVLSRYRIDDLVQILHKHGYRLPFNHNDPESYFKDLKTVADRSKSLLVLLNDKVAQLGILENAESGQEPISRKYYNHTLAILSKFGGYAIEEGKITVGRYIGIVNHYVEYCEALNKK